MSLPVALRGATGAIGRHAAIGQKQQQLPAMMYMRQSIAIAHQRRQERNLTTVRAASTSAKAPTTILSQKEALELLNEQRSLRPNSPHLTIYEPQLTWYGSIANRITGTGLSACELSLVQRDTISSFKGGIDAQLTNSLYLPFRQCSTYGVFLTWLSHTLPLVKFSRLLTW